MKDIIIIIVLMLSVFLIQPVLLLQAGSCIHLVCFHWFVNFFFFFAFLEQYDIPDATFTFLSSYLIKQS